MVQFVQAHYENCEFTPVVCVTCGLTVAKSKVCKFVMVLMRSWPWLYCTLTKISNAPLISLRSGITEHNVQYTSLTCPLFVSRIEFTFLSLLRVWWLAVELESYLNLGGGVGNVTC